LPNSLSFSTNEHNFKGVFETMLFKNGRIALFELHATRMLKSLEIMGFEVKLDIKKIYFQIETLTNSNKLNTAKIKWQFFVDDKNNFHQIIETYSTYDEIANWNEKGWNLGLVEWSNSQDFKLNNTKYIRPKFYSETKVLIEKNNWDDAILTIKNKVIESSIGNVFLIKDDFVSTPALESGCVAGVMRQFLINFLKSENRIVKEKEIHIDELFEADELFITNALRGIKWVKSLENKSFASFQTKKIVDEIK